MAAKKKTAKKTPAKSAKSAKSRKKSSASVSALAAASNVETLAAAGVIDPQELSGPQQTAINSKLSASDVETMISVFGKLGGPTKGRVQVQLCF